MGMCDPSSPGEDGDGIHDTDDVARGETQDARPKRQSAART